MIPVLTLLEKGVSLPKYATTGSSGVDLAANIDSAITLQPLERTLVPTGIRISLPTGCEAQIRPRSGLAWKRGLTVLNTPGTIDSDYRGDVGVILVNLSNEEQRVDPGERIAQMVFSVVGSGEFITGPSLDETGRGEGGFGSTGTK